MDKLMAVLRRFRQWHLILPVLALAALSSGTTTHTVTVVKHAPVKAAISVAHPCAANDYYMQCGLAGQPQARTFGSAFSTAQGIDFAWSCPSPIGHSFGISYFSPDLSKNWTRGCVNAYHAAHAATVPVYESGQFEAQAGFNAGFNDAFRARRQARGVGEPDNRPIPYAVDCDCAGRTLVSYFQGADAGTASILHVSHSVAVSLTNAYGGYYQIRYLFNAGVVGHTNWQTYAWSVGQWLPPSIAPLEQYLNASAVDYDRALLPDYGQWPYKAKPVGPSNKTIVAWRKFRDDSFRIYRQDSCTAPQMVTGTPAWGSPNGCHDSAAGVITYQGKLWTVPRPGYGRWACFGKHARLKTAVCGVIRPQVSWQSHARHSSWRVYSAAGCPGPVYSPKHHRGRCARFSGSWRYFNAKANQTVRAYS